MIFEVALFACFGVLIDVRPGFSYSYSAKRYSVKRYSVKRYSYSKLLHRVRQKPKHRNFKTHEGALSTKQLFALQNLLDPFDKTA
jgi:hypothetical protein